MYKRGCLIAEQNPVTPPVSDVTTREFDLREREVSAREREVKAREEEIKRSRWVNPLVIGLLLAAGGWVVNAWVAYLNNSNLQRLQQLQAPREMPLISSFFFLALLIN
jgi:hypothetical protein